VFELEATVFEEATGVSESLVDRSIKLVQSAYVIKFSRSQQYFKPGLPFDFKVRSNLVGFSYLNCTLHVFGSFTRFKIKLR
jgi:hypothetical protein